MGAGIIPAPSIYLPCPLQAIGTYLSDISAVIFLAISLTVIPLHKSSSIEL